MEGPEARRSAPLPAAAPGAHPPSAGTRSLPPLPLLATKFALPAPSSTLVSRPRLTTRLQPTPTSRLALLVAPAGSGKSWVVSEWCQQNENARIAWLSLDASDNKPTRFLLYVSAALETVAPAAAA